MRSTRPAQGASMTSLRSRAHPFASATAQRQHLDSLRLPVRFEAALARTGLDPLRATGIEILQMNLGKVCNQTCRHCHVDAGPDRRETMSDAVVEACLAALTATAIPTVDITGGAPELHPRFREIVTRVSARGRHTIDRCNRTMPLPAAYEEL